MNPNPWVLAKEFVKTNLIPQNFRLRRKPKNIDFSVLNLRIATHPPPPPGGSYIHKILGLGTLSTHIVQLNPPPLVFERGKTRGGV